jgi:hypothetical protein
MNAPHAGVLSGLEAVLVDRAPPVQDLVEMMIRAPPARHALKVVLSRRLLAHHREFSSDPVGLESLVKLARGGHQQWRDALWDLSLDVLLDIEELDPDAGGEASLEERHEARTTQPVPAALAALASACLDDAEPPEEDPAGERAALEARWRLVAGREGGAPDGAARPAAAAADARMLRLLRAAGCAGGGAAAARPPCALLDWLLVVVGRAHPRAVLSWLCAALLAGPPPGSAGGAGGAGGAPAFVEEGAWSELPAARALDALASLRGAAWAAVAPAALAAAAGAGGAGPGAALRVAAQCPRATTAALPGLSLSLSPLPLVLSGHAASLTPY